MPTTTEVALVKGSYEAATRIAIAAAAAAMTHVKWDDMAQVEAASAMATAILAALMGGSDEAAVDAIMSAMGLS